MRTDRLGRRAAGVRRCPIPLPASGREGAERLFDWRDQPFPKTHDLGRLGKQAVDLDPTLEQRIDEVVEFTKYAWLFRYPGDVDEPSLADAAAALNKVRGFVGALLAQLPDEAR